MKAILVFIVISLIGCVVGQTRDRVTVGLFEWVPYNADQVNVVKDFVKRTGLDLVVNVTNFNPYIDPVFDNIPDVVVLDTILLPSFVKANIFEPAAIFDRTKYFDFAVESSYYQNTSYGVPQYICSNFLLSLPDEDYRNLGFDNEVYGDGPNSTYSVVTPYFDLTHALPQKLEQVNKVAASTVLSVQRKFLTNISNFLTNTTRKSLYAYSERASDLNPVVANELIIRTVNSLSNRIVFFTDIVSIKRGLTKRALGQAQEVVNYITSTNFFEALRVTNPRATYVTPAIKSVLASYSEPLYRQIQTLLSSERILRLATHLQFPGNDTEVRIARQLIEQSAPRKAD